MSISIKNQAQLNRIEVWLIVKILAMQLNLKKYVISGSYRRGKWIMNDIDLLITISSEAEIEGYRRLMAANGWLQQLNGKSAESVFREQFVKKIGNKNIVLDLFMSPPGCWGNCLFFTTGSRHQNDIIRDNLIDRGLSWHNPRMFRDLINHVDISFDDEKRVFDFLNLKYVPPSKRI